MHVTAAQTTEYGSSSCCCHCYRLDKSTVIFLLHLHTTQSLQIAMDWTSELQLTRVLSNGIHVSTAAAGLNNPQQDFHADSVDAKAWAKAQQGQHVK